MSSTCMRFESGAPCDIAWHPLWNRPKQCWPAVLRVRPSAIHRTYHPRERSRSSAPARGPVRVEDPPHAHLRRLQQAGGATLGAFVSRHVRRTTYVSEPRVLAKRVARQSGANTLPALTRMRARAGAPRKAAGAGPSMRPPRPGCPGSWPVSIEHPKMHTRADHECCVDRRMQRARCPTEARIRSPGTQYMYR